MSASAILTDPEALSKDSILILEFFEETFISTISGWDFFSWIPYELFDTQIIFTKPLSVVWLKALFVKHDLLTIKGFILIGTETTFDANPALSWTANKGAIYLESAVELRIKIDTSSFVESSEIVSA